MLFLGLGEPGELVYVWHDGRGRLPIREVNGKRFATLWVGDVRLPEGTPTIDGPEQQYTFIRSIELSILRDLVKQFLEAPSK